jgi:hypothetical protein
MVNDTAGTHRYKAFEMFMGVKFQPQLTDVYSLGLSLLEGMFGNYPFG